jgi:heterodisulfide reductase subunit D
MSSPSRHGSLRQESLTCAQCGACREVCPAFRSLGWESSSPRGRMSVVKALTTREHRVSMATTEQVTTLCQCTLCGACGQACAALIDTREVWLEARAALAHEGKAASEYVHLAEAVRQAKNVAALDNETRLEWAEDADEEMILACEDAEPCEIRAEVDVLYFVGCMASFYPRAAEVALALTEIMQAAGVRFAVLGGQEWCCGFPLAASGYPDDARSFREHNIEKILASGATRLLTACPTCFHTYARECGEQLHEAGVEVVHSSQFLLQLVAAGKLALKESSGVATYHDPCDLGRNSGVYDEPREILRHIPGLSFIELPSSREAATCCGGGGNLQSVDPRLVDSIADARAEEVATVGADVVVSACQQCEQVLETAIRRRGLPTRVVDICEFVLECMTRR